MRVSFFFIYNNDLLGSSSAAPFNIDNDAPEDAITSELPSFQEVTTAQDNLNIHDSASETLDSVSKVHPSLSTGQGGNEVQYKPMETNFSSEPCPPTLLGPVYYNSNGLPVATGTQQKIVEGREALLIVCEVFQHVSTPAKLF
jgi:hypothetical protein